MKLFLFLGNLLVNRSFTLGSLLIIQIKKSNRKEEKSIFRAIE